MTGGYNFLELSRAVKNSYNTIDVKNGKKIKIFVLADSASQHLCAALKGSTVLQGISADIREADFDQIDLQINDDESEMHRWHPDYIVIFECVQKLWEHFCKQTEEGKKEFAQRRFERLSGYLRKINENISGCNMIFPLYIEYDDRIYGNRGLTYVGSFIYQVKKLNCLIMEYASKTQALYLVNTGSIGILESAGHLDEGRYCNYKLALPLDSIAELAMQFTHIIGATIGKTIKCVVLDLDNTIWGGIIGDDGIENIEIGELGIGYVFQRFQIWLKNLKNRGILLCVCSKNEVGIAIKPFREHPDMVLREEDITLFVANWSDKASNIKYIQETLNIGLDSIAFIDDSPFERSQVKSKYPQITVPEMPEDPAEYVSYLESLNLFETNAISENDSNRTMQYKQEADRRFFEKKTNNATEFLAGLFMEGTGNLFEPFYYPRIAQLTQRSNQFNLRTVRYTEGDIVRIAESKEYIPLYFTLKDSFGDYGLISVIILQITGKYEGFIDTWLMSCRVLKRGVEDFALNTLVSYAKKHGIKRIVGEYLKTPKNMMVEHFFEQMGFSPIAGDATRYELLTEDYVPHKHFIKREADDGRE